MLVIVRRPSRPDQIPAYQHQDRDLISELQGVWFGLLLRESLAGNSWHVASEQDVSDPNLRLPSSMDVLLQGGIDVLFFVLGCALFVFEGERFFRNQYEADGASRAGHDPDLSGFLFVLVFPLLFGSVAVMRIFLATARCQLYYAALRDGILLKFQHKTSYFEPMLLWVYLGLAICIGKALQIMLMGRYSSDGLKALLVLMSPLYYMTSSIFDILYTEFAVCNQHCTVALKVISEEPIQIGSDMVCMSDSTFCGLARRREKITRESRHSAEGEASDGFWALDLAWLGRLLGQRASGAKKLLLLLFDPMQALTFLCLALLTCWVGLKILLHEPRLTNLQVIGGAISSPFAGHVRDYNILVDRVQTMVSVSAQANPKDVTELTMRDSSESDVQWTWGGSIAKAVTLDKDHYPYNLQIDVWDTTAHNSYAVQILKSGFLPESVTVTGRTSSGKTFHRCVPWGFLWLRPWINIPSEVRSVEMSISMAHFVMGIPENSRRAGRFTTHFYPNLTEQECDKQHSLMPWCAVAQATDNGCFVVQQPLWDNCGQAGQEEARHFLRVRSSTLSAELCSDQEHQCRIVEAAEDPVLSFDNISIAKTTDDAEEYSVKLSVKKGSSVLPIVDATNFYRVVDLRLIPGPPRASGLLHFHLSAQNVTTSGVQYSSHGHRWMATIWDSAAFKTEQTMKITAVSFDVDCVLESFQVFAPEGVVPLKVVQPDSIVCRDTPMAEGCADGNGFLPTRAFEIDLNLVRNLIVFKGVYTDSVLHFSGVKRCRAFEGFYGEYETVQMNFEHVTQTHMDLLVHASDGSIETTGHQCENVGQHSLRCAVHVEGRGLGNANLMRRVNLTTIFAEPNCSVRWTAAWDAAYPDLEGLVDSAFPVVPIDPADCSQYDLLAGTTACGGWRPSATTSLDLAPANGAIEEAPDVSLTTVQGYVQCHTFIDAMLQVNIAATGGPPLPPPPPT
ncbi:unnamed protein product [Symbiodinium natans]|uniref:Uncharacterized protein n=1 Tax=Symbiodinium natans TaxID=878477 RepID=A0A812QW96_9DINO|nr:unnamed protein product [Symbiodinium natans]